MNVDGKHCRFTSKVIDLNQLSEYLEAFVKESQLPVNLFYEQTKQNSFNLASPETVAIIASIIGGSATIAASIITATATLLPKLRKDNRLSIKVTMPSEKSFCISEQTKIVITDELKNLIDSYNIIEISIEQDNNK